MNANPNAVRIDILVGPHTAHGVVHTVLDVLNTLQALAQMRAPLARPVVRWRLRSQSPRSAMAWPRSTWPHLPRQGFRGPADLLLVPGWHVFSGPEIERRARLQAWALPHLAEVHARGGQVLAVGTGVALLADSAWLRGRQAVAPWTFMPTIARLAPQAQLLSDRALTVHERIWTCDSPVQATAMLLQALQSTPLAELAGTAAQALLHTPERQSVVAQLVAEGAPRPVSAGPVERARRWLEAHPSEPYDLPTLAQHAATSARTLLRHFENTHGISPHAYQRRLRMARAKVLLETTYQPIEQVALACGYADVGTFRRLFRADTGVLPAAWREQHRLRTSRARWSGPAAGA